MFLTNFHERDKSKYIKAVKEYKRRTGNNDIYVDNNAYANGHKLDEHCALRSNSGSIDNLQIFYRIEEELALKGLDVIYKNIKTKEELFGTIDEVKFNDNGLIIGYMVTNCNNPYDVYVEDYISLEEYTIRKNRR